ncbi:7899_t:CDS:2 [Ambispora leptoticha]|uniref:7899_t:CDS:1 n=1 Tax=Ambispora leptoticha TaxID=144679 RepID=A0A9N9AEA3_9GLOM|nr:7899_t:CDS:2 [Ambispora leptoticha]
MATVFKLAKAQKEGNGPSSREAHKEKNSEEQKAKKNKQRVLVLSSRGINFRQRHLLNDLAALSPHFKKGMDAKLDQKSQFSILNELAELNNCNNCLFFEVRRKEDLYLWASKTPNGPSIKFHVQNIHTMDELKMTGNCLKGSRPIVSFDKTFDTQPHFSLIKQVFTHIFSVPRGARRSKPFIDHLISFTIADNRIWFRNYQIVEKDPTEVEKNQKDITLVEIGPRFVLNVIRIFEGSFNGATIFANPEFITPTQIRRNIKAEKAARYQSRVQSKEVLRHKLSASVLPFDPMERS